MESKDWFLVINYSWLDGKTETYAISSGNAW